MVADAARMKGMDWEASLGRPGQICAVSGEAIGEGMEFVSALELGEEGLERRDYLPEHFDEERPEVFAHWRGRIHPPDADKPRPLDMNFLADFFRRLQGEGGHLVPGREEVTYIVSLLLVRKKVLVLEGGGTEGEREYMTLRFKQGEDSTLYSVLVPEIDEEKMEAIRDDLGRIFNLGDAALEPKASEEGGSGELVEREGSEAAAEEQAETERD